MRSSTCRRTWKTGWLAALAALLAGLLVPGGAGAAPGDVLVLDHTASAGSGAVIRVDEQTGARSIVSTDSAPVGEPNLDLTAGIALSPAGEILVLREDGGDEGPAVIRVDPQTGARTMLSHNYGPDGLPWFDIPRGIAVEPDGDILIADQTAFGSGGLIRVHPETGARSTLSSNAAPVDLPLFASPAAVAVAPNGDIFVADTLAFGGSPGVIRVNPETGARSALSWNGAAFGEPKFVEPVGLTVAANGDLLVADRAAFGGSGGVMRVDPQSGARTAVSTNIVPFGDPSFASLRAIALAANGDLMVADSEAFGGPGGVIRIDPQSGARTSVSRNGVPPGGPSFVEPWGVAVEPGAEPPTAPAEPTTTPPPPPSPPPPSPPPPPSSGDTLAPEISRLSLTNRRFRVGRRATPIASRAPVGTRFGYTLSEPATVRLRIERARPGRRVGRRCLLPTRRRRTRPRCIRLVATGSLAQQGAAGPNRLRFSGRTTLVKLSPGSYRARFQATDESGNRSATHSLSFQIVR